MRLASYRVDGTPRFGAVTDRGVVDLVDRLGVATLADAIAGDALGEAAALVAAGPHADHAVDGLEWLPPIPEPRRILCIGVNYRAHRDETGRPDTAHPVVFTRFASSLVGHRRPVVRPVESDRFDYEGELALVVGRPGRRIAPADALGHVAGWSCFMDGSVRDFQRHTSQFTPGKNFDRSGSMGPWLVTPDELGDPSRSRVRTRVDGVTYQDATTDLMIDDVATIIAYCSTFTTLEPGDVIATGTPGGVGDRRDPPVRLRAGSVVEVEVDGVGVLVNPVVDG